MLKGLRALNDFVYLLSIPFVVLVLAGIVMKSRPMALAGATGVILLNIGRLVTNGFALFVRPFKTSPVHGILFFLPPYTLYYVATRWKSMKKATLCFLEPALTIGLVVLAFTLVPWLSSGNVDEQATLTERLRTESGTLKSDMRDELEEKGSSLGGLSEKARQGMDRAKNVTGARRDSPVGEPNNLTESPR